MFFFIVTSQEKKTRDRRATERNCNVCVHRALICVRHMHVLRLYVPFVVVRSACVTDAEEQTNRQSTLADVLKVVKLVDALTDEFKRTRTTMAAQARNLILSLSLVDRSSWIGTMPYVDRRWFDHRAHETRLMHRERYHWQLEADKCHRSFGRSGHVVWSPVYSMYGRRTAVQQRRNQRSVLVALGFRRVDWFLMMISLLLLLLLMGLLSVQSMQGREIQSWHWCARRWSDVCESNWWFQCWYRCDQCREKIGCGYKWDDSFLGEREKNLSEKCVWIAGIKQQLILQ